MQFLFLLLLLFSFYFNFFFSECAKQHAESAVVEAHSVPIWELFLSYYFVDRTLTGWHLVRLIAFFFLFFSFDFSDSPARLLASSPSLGEETVEV